MSARSSFCLLCCRSRDADVLGVGVGLEAVSARYIIYPFLLQTITPRVVCTGDAGQRKDNIHLSFAKETSFLQSHQSLISQRSRCSFCDFVRCQLNTFINRDEEVCLHLRIYKTKHPFNTNSRQITVVKLILSQASVYLLPPSGGSCSAQIVVI